MCDVRDFPQHLRRFFQQPACVGEPAGGADLCGEARNAACGDHLVLYLKLSDGTVEAAGFRAQGCPATLATAAAACEVLTGLPVDAALPDALVTRFVEAYATPQPAHRHALALVRTALADTRPARSASATA
jgi:NifU-like protein involved in Fe-S cluster formation